MSVQGIPVSIVRIPGVAVSEPFRGQRLAHLVEIEAQFSAREPRPHRRFLVLARARTGKHGGGLLARHDADAIIVGHHEIAGIHERAGTHQRHVDAAERGLDGALRRDIARPHGKAHFGQRTHVAHTGFDDEAEHAAAP